MTGKARKIACAILIGKTGDFLLQLRDDKPGLIFANMIGLFGGHREGDETFLECVRREIREETGFAPPASEFEPLVKIQTRYPDGAQVEGHFYVLHNVPENRLTITEGTLISIGRDDLPVYLNRMTPATAFVVKTFLDLEAGRD